MKMVKIITISITRAEILTAIEEWMRVNYQEKILKGTINFDVEADNDGCYSDLKGASFNIEVK